MMDSLHHRILVQKLRALGTEIRVICLKFFENAETDPN